MKILYLILNSWFKRTTIQHFALSVAWGLLMWGGGRAGCAAPPQWPATCQTSLNRSESVPDGEVRSRGLDWVPSQLAYTSTPLMRDPSKTMVKSWMVCRMRMRELTVMRSRRRALSSYIRVMAGHSANSGIHCGSRRSLRAQTETSPECGWRWPCCRTRHILEFSTGRCWFP